LRKRYSLWILIVAVILLISGCTEHQEQTNQQLVPKNSESSDPEAFKTFLSTEKIPNGDIYLQDNKVHINIVGLDSKIEQRFAQNFTKGSYVLHDVKYSMQELLAVQKDLLTKELHQKLNLYGSDIDTIGNRVKVTIPSDYAAAAILEIEKRIDPNMLSYSISELGDPHVVGQIVAVESDKAKRILILEPGMEDPSYWFSFNQKSALFNEAGEPINFKDLKEGQQVKLWSTGTVEESFPALASIRRLELYTPK